MEKLKIIKIENNNYKLLNIKTSKLYNFNLTFFDLEKELQVDDFIFMHNELLDEKYDEYSTDYIFGPLNEVYGREIKSKDDVDLIKIKTKEKTIYLKRFFG